jgi:hypothetical protein
MIGDKNLAGDEYIVADIYAIDSCYMAIVLHYHIPTYSYSRGKRLPIIPVYRFEAQPTACIETITKFDIAQPFQSCVPCYMEICPSAPSPSLRTSRYGSIRQPLQ